jgi:hypothetical protein
MWGEAVDADIGYEPNGEIEGWDLLTFGKLDEDVSSSMKWDINA